MGAAATVHRDHSRAHLRRRPLDPGEPATFVDAGTAVLVTEHGGLGVTIARAVQAAAESALRRRGITVLEDVRFDAATLIDLVARQSILDAGATRLFVVSLAGHEQGTTVTLEEVDLEDGDSIFMASRLVSGDDQAEAAMDELVAGVLARQPARAARRTTTTGFWIIGVIPGPLGGSLEWAYGSRRWRVGVAIQATRNDVAFAGIDAAWVTRDGDIAPYVGFGLGSVIAGDEEEGTLGAKLEAGLELHRRGSTHLLCGTTVIVPLGGTGNPVNPAVHLKLLF